MADLQDAGFWGRWMARLTGRHHLDKGSKAAPFTGEHTQSGAAVTANTAQKLSAVWACVRLRAETISTLPLHLRELFCFSV